MLTTVHNDVKKNGSLKEPRICRIFFSSPFGGMEEEREELTRKYFPQIQHACNAKGIQFVAVDMRWGITTAAAEQAQVINICLREVDRSDLFVGFFGQRYGWHGATDSLLQANFDNAMGRYPWLDKVRERSVTELEFLHGHLNQPGTLAACFCFRSKDYDDAQCDIGIAKGDKKHVFKYTAESDHAAAMLNDLKARVKATEEKTLGIELAYANPKEGSKFIFDTIWPYLNNVLLAGVSEKPQSKRQEQQNQHSAFQAQYLNVYEGGQKYLDYLNNMLEAGQRGNVVVTGPAGCGKSALLSNWASHLETSGADSDTVVIYHAIGCAPGSINGSDVLSRLLVELKHVLGRDTETASKTVDIQAKPEPHSVQTLQPQLQAAMEEIVIEKKKRIVVILDGLNRSPKAVKTSKHLFWIPSTFPSGVFFVASTVETDTLTLDLLVKERKHDILTIKPLDRFEKERICMKVLKKSGKELQDEQLAKVTAAEQTKNPLFLRLVLTELSIFGYFRLLDQKIDSLISCANVEELLQKMFVRLEDDYNGREKNVDLLKEVFCTIELCHHGLQEKELMEILDVEANIWLPLYFAMEGLLVSYDGLLRFGFAEVSNAVRSKYLENLSDKQKVLKKIIKYFDGQLQRIPLWEDLMTPHSQRPVEELPWLHLAAGDIRGLESTLLNIFTLWRLQQNYKFEFLELWKATGRSMAEICHLYESALDTALAELYLHGFDLWDTSNSTPGMKIQPLMDSLRDFFTVAGYSEGAVKMSQREIRILKHAVSINPSETLSKLLLNSRYSLACDFAECQQYKEAEELHRHIMEQCQSYLIKFPNDSDHLQMLGFAHNGIGFIYHKLRRFDEAVGMFEESVKYHSLLENSEENIAGSLENIGTCHMLNNKPEEGIGYMQKALVLLEKIHFGHLPLIVARLFTNLGICYRRLGDFDQAEAMYKRSLEIKANLVGWDHDDVAMIYTNLCALYTHKQDYAAAEQYCHKAMAIFEGNGATLDKTEYWQATENLIGNLLSLSRVEEAATLYLPLFAKLKEIGFDWCMVSIHVEMAKYFLYIGNAAKAREITEALLDSKERSPGSFIMLDHLQGLLPEDQRPPIPDHHTLDYALTVWPGDPDITKRLIQYHALPVRDVGHILELIAASAAKNPQFQAVPYEECATWCVEGGNMEVACICLQDLRLRLMDHYRTMRQFKQAYPHLPAILEGRSDDPACLVVAGEVAVHSGDLLLALECWQKAASMDNPKLALIAKNAIETLNRCMTDSSNSDEIKTQTPPENGVDQK